MVRVGLIGCGIIGTVHAARLAQIENVDFVAAVDIIPERAEKIAQEHGARAFTDYTDILDLVDVVWVCTPPDTHRDITVTCLSADLHVFCEKPMALSLAEADDMIAAAKSSGKLWGIGYCLRFLPWADKCRQLVADGELGEISMAWIARMSDMPGTDWLGIQERSGGMLTEQTTHNIDWLRYVLGDVTKVHGMAKTVLPNVTIADNVVGLLEFANGAIGQLMASWSCAANWIDSGIVGTKGVLRTGQGGKITVDRFGEETQVYEPESLDMYLVQDQAFIDAISNGGTWPMDPEEAKKSLAVSLGVLEAAKTGQPVTL